MYVHVVENTTLFIYVHVPVIQQCTNRIHVYNLTIISLSCTALSYIPLSYNMCRSYHYYYSRNQVYRTTVVYQGQDINHTSTAHTLKILYREANSRKKHLVVVLPHIV